MSPHDNDPVSRTYDTFHIGPSGVFLIVPVFNVLMNRLRRESPAL